MEKILIFGNSGSGKSTLAKKLANTKQLAHLDLDTLAWLPTSPPERTTIEKAYADINKFTQQHSNWVIEGCYSDLLTLLLDQANEIIFMDLTVDDCIKNAKSRPWEPHKYPSKQAQDENLAMLINWIKAYEQRDDVFSLSAHQQLFDSFQGRKHRYITNISAQ
ncbi:AAA family ATPase [Colwelliaceae bacterium 6471]